MNLRDDVVGILGEDDERSAHCVEEAGCQEKRRSRSSLEDERAGWPRFVERIHRNQCTAPIEESAKGWALADRLRPGIDEQSPLWPRKPKSGAHDECRCDDRGLVARTNRSAGRCWLGQRDAKLGGEQLTLPGTEGLFESCTHGSASLAFIVESASAIEADLHLGFSLPNVFERRSARRFQRVAPSLVWRGSSLALVGLATGNRCAKSCNVAVV